MNPTPTRDSLGVLFLLVVATGAAGCSYSGPAVAPQVVAVPGQLTPAKGLAASDFEVWGSAAEASSAVAAGGTFSSQGAGWHAGIAFAVPKAGSALVADAALYMSPSLGLGRMVAQPAGYAVASEGAMAMDSTTTVLSMLLLHPTLAHPSIDVATRQLNWMLTKLGGSWPALKEAAAAYDAAVVARTDFSSDAAFVTAFETCLADAAEIPEFTPPAITAEQLGTIQQGLDPVEHMIAVDGKKVSTLVAKAADDKGVTLQLGTRNGTALDYRYLVRRIDPAATREGLKSALLSPPNQLQVNPTTGVLAEGYIAASSYWGYVDVVGNTLKKLSGLVTAAAGAVFGAPNTRVTFPAQGFYEVRLVSGGMGAGLADQPATFAAVNLRAEYTAAMMNNLTVAAVEAISLVPGVNEMLGDEAGQKTLLAAVQQSVIEAQKILASGTKLTATDLYNSMYAVLKKAVDSYVAEVIKKGDPGQGQGLLRKGFAWVVGGGQKVIKFIGSVPSKVAKGGAASNRIYRLVEPESILEYYVVGVAPYTPPVPTCVDESRDVTCGVAASSLVPHCEDAANNCGNPVTCGACAVSTCGPKAYSAPVSTSTCVTTADCPGQTWCVSGRCATPYTRTCLCSRLAGYDATCTGLGLAYQNAAGTTGCSTAGCVKKGTVYCCQ